MSLFEDSIVKDLVEKWKVVERKDHNKTGAYFKLYEQVFIDEIMERATPHKEAMMKQLKYLCKTHAEEIELFLFSYKMTVFGDSKTQSINKKKKFKDDETYLDAAIRLGYHKLCREIPDAPVLKEKNDDGEEVERKQRPPALHYVYEFTDVRYKLAEKFGDSFTIIKKFRPTTNTEEEFGSKLKRLSDKAITYQVSLFLRFHPLGIDDDDWIAKRPVKAEATEEAE
jgi:hypothetical protein